MSLPDTWQGQPNEYLGFQDSDVIRKDLFTKDELIAKFDAGNYAVFAAMLLVSAVIGVYFWWRGKRNNTNNTIKVVNDVITVRLSALFKALLATTAIACFLA